jgi:hypothetical protein
MTSLGLSLMRELPPGGVTTSRANTAVAAQALSPTNTTTDLLAPIIRPEILTSN